MVRGDGLTQLLDHLGLGEVGRRQSREVSGSSLLNLLTRVVLEALGDPRGLGTQVVGGALLDCPVGQSRTDDGREVNVGQLGQLLAQIPKVEGGQVKAGTRLQSRLHARRLSEGGQVELGQVHPGHVQVGKVESGQVHAGEVHAGQVHLELRRIHLECRL